MKKFLVFIMSALFVLGLASCKKKKAEPVEVDPTFNTILCDEYKTIKDTAPTTVYYTSLIELDTTVKDEMVVKVYSNVYQDGQLSTIITHTPIDIQVSKKNDFWCEDVAFSPDTLNLSLEAAYERLMQAEIIKPNPLWKVVLREPLGPKTVNPMYIFGQGKYFVAVDAVTGEVKIVQ